MSDGPTPERGDIIVFKKRKMFPTERWQEYETVVETVTDTSVYCGLDGGIPLEHVVEIKGKSPDYNPETDSFETTVVN
jgi:hypothetical protein